MKYLPDRSQVAQVGQDVLNNQVIQRSLFFQYQQIHNSGLPLPKLTDTGFRVYSQTDEDGILLYIFSLIGFSNKTCVDIAAGSPVGANTTNLICNWGWSGLLIEGNEALLNEARGFYTLHRDTWLFPPKMVNVWVTAENINDILEMNGITGEVDLFSLDVDGVDYWLWKSLTVIQPRVVLLEYQDIWGPEKSVTVPYDAHFKRPDSSYNYCGASLSAFVKLGREKGYRLVGCNRYGFNAFFVRDDVGCETLPEISTYQCFQHQEAVKVQKERLALAKTYVWEEA